MRRRVLAAVSIALACRPEPAPALATAPELGAHPEKPGSRGRIPDVPALVVHNREGSGIEIYGAYIVDASGEIGTRLLWPHGSDCPGVQPPPHLVAGGGMLVLPPPAEAYVDGSCTPSPLPAGDYVVRLGSGYGEELYAAAAVTLPLSGPVELEMTQHESGPPCDPALARRAARLAFAAAEAAGSLPPEFRRECDVKQARCGTLPIESDLPPQACTVTLHERLLRIERAAGDDAPRWLTAWADHEIVSVLRPDVTRTSASRLDIDGKPVVVAGITDHHIHEHGGDAAQIGSAAFLVHNPHARPLRLRVRQIEFLDDGQCGLPREVRARPKLAPGAPTELAPGRSEIDVGFAAQPAYQAHCDRFATRVTFEVEGERIAATVEHEVTREDPIREP